MSVVAMSHLRLIGLRREQNKIIDKLTSRGMFEVRATDCVRSELVQGDTSLYRELKLKQGKISFALDFLKSRHAAMSFELKANARAVKKGLAEPIDYTLSDVKYGGGRMLITKADFSDAAAKEYELLHVCDELQTLSFDLVDCQSRINSLKSTIAAYSPFVPAPIKLSELSRQGGISLALFHGRTNVPPTELLNGLPCAYDIRYGDGLVIITVCRAENQEEINKQLGALGYTRCVFDDDCTAAQKVDALTTELADIKRQMSELTKSALAYEKYVGELRILYDVAELDIERAEAEEKFAKTDSTFVLEGWIPEAVAQQTAAELDETATVFIQLLAPEERDEPPTLVQNNKVVKPYEQITDMYSSPRYREIDPNPVMAVFYFLFFGIMIGDAGYGLILAVLGLIIGRSKKFDTGLRQLALLIGMGGISAIIWGILFGGYFGIDFDTVKVALWFNPLEEPLTMLIVSIVLGCVQITVGYIVKFIALCKDGKPFSAVFDCGSIIILFCALACLGIYMLLDAPPFGLALAAIILAGIGVALIVVFGGRASKNVFGKVLGGLKGLYGLVNIFSDILSYCRLFGLGLASCAIALAFNTLGGILFDISVPVIGYVLGIVILIPLHAFNLGIGILGAYVHDARLQFMEFYGKFYEGGGRPFAPLGQKTKYIRYN